jgi:hypothetical protein
MPAPNVIMENNHKMKHIMKASTMFVGGIIT